MRVVPPKIAVHYLVEYKPEKTRRRWVLPAFLMVTLVVGALGGGLTVWQSKFGEANRDVETATSQVLDQEVSTTIPLSFDESELNVVSDLLPILIQEYRHEPTPEELEQQAYQQRKDKLRNYLASMKSPLAQEDTALDALLQSRNMKMMLAISFVESNMCRRQVGYNCSGIGGGKMRKYPNFAGWIKDFDNLLERRYKGLPVEKFIGYYVQPGSQNWVDGVYQILGALKRRQIE